MRKPTLALPYQGGDNAFFNFLFSFLVVIFPLGQMPQLLFPNQIIRVNLLDIWVGVFLVFILYFEREFFSKIRLVWIVGMVMLASLILRIFDYEFFQIFIASLYMVRWVSYMAVGIYLYKKSQDFDFSRQIILITFLFCTIGLLQYFFLPNLNFLFPQGWDRHDARIAFPLIDANYTGLIFVMYIIYFIYQYLISANTKNNFLNFQSKAFIFTGVISVICLLLTYSRSSYLAFIVSLTYLLIRYKRSYVLITLSFFILAITQLPVKMGESTNLFRTSTIEARLQNYQEAFDLWLESPLLGQGFNLLEFKKVSVVDPRVSVSHSQSGFDNGILFILATGGLFLFFVFVWFGYSVLLIVNFHPLAISLLLAIFVHGMFQNSWFYPWVIVWFWVLIGQKKDLSNLS